MTITAKGFLVVIACVSVELVAYRRGIGEVLSRGVRGEAEGVLGAQRRWEQRPETARKWFIVA